MNVSSIKLSLLIFLMLAAASEVCAQTSARFSGTVKDQSGGTVAGASVTLTNQATNVNQATKTDGEGNYLFARVEAGTYRLTVEHG